jgi:hypothetical protein
MDRADLGVVGCRRELIELRARRRCLDRATQQLLVLGQYAEAGSGALSQLVCDRLQHDADDLINPLEFRTRRGGIRQDARHRCSRQGDPPGTPARRAPIIVVLLYTGLRLAELVALDVDDVKMSARKSFQ